MINFSEVFLPFCLVRLEGATYVVLNRAGKPVGLATEKRVDYSEHPVRIGIRGLTPERIARLSFNGNADPEQIFLYDQTVDLTGEAGGWAAYAARLQLLSEIVIESAASMSRYVEVPGYPTFLAR